MVNSNYDSLKLGYKIDNKGDPVSLQTQNTTNSKKIEIDFEVSSDKMANHMIIIAQSGSGKSFFLGRLIEELMLKSKSKCLILDPNGDYKQIYNIDNSLWGSETQNKYDKKTGIGKLTPENKNEFESKWNNLIKEMVIKTNGTIKKKYHQEKIKIWWPSVQINFLTSTADLQMSNEMFHYHELARKILNQTSKFDKKETESVMSILKKIFQSLLNLSDKEIEKFLKEEMKIKMILKSDLEAKLSRAAKSTLELFVTTYLKNLSSSDNSLLHNFNKLQNKDSESPFFRQFNKDTLNYYMRLLQRYESLGIIADGPDISKEKRLQVIDLPSIDDHEARSFVISSMLSQKWEQARKEWSDAMNKNPNDDKRVPLFVILDEAHNLVPAEPRNHREIIVREQFRTIAAEGRKLGIYLILISQRPDKLDHLVTSECKNKVIMKLDSGILDQVAKNLGLENKSIEDATKFKLGRIIALGDWVGEPVKFFSAARRTIEGGRNLNPEFWAKGYY